jgi:MFS family permease
MGRKILAVIVAMIVAFAVITIVQMLNTLMVPPPSSDVMSDPAKMREFMASMPASAYAMVLIGYVLGAFAGGFIVTKMGRQVSTGVTLAIVVGVLLMVGGVLNFFVLLPGQPVWFVAASMLCYVPISLLGHRFAR